MIFRRPGLALALAIFPCAFAMAQSTSTIEAPPGSGVRLPKMVVVDPNTGLPATAAAGYSGPAAVPAGQSSGNAMPVQRADGKAPFTAGEAVSQTGGPWAVSWTGQSVGITGAVQLGAGSAAIGSVSVSNFPTTQQVAGTVNVGNLPTSYPDAGADTALGAPGDNPATAPGSNGSISALLKAIRDKQISGQTVTDAQNAPYGLSGAANITPGAPGSSTTPGRAMKVRCPASNAPGSGAAPVAGSGYVVLTLAGGQTVQQALANGGEYTVPYAVASIGNQVVETGTLATCTYQNMN